MAAKSAKTGKSNKTVKSGQASATVPEKPRGIPKKFYESDTDA